MKLFLYINAKKIEIVIFYFDNYLWKVGIQIIFWKDVFFMNYILKQYDMIIPL